MDCKIIFELKLYIIDTNNVLFVVNIIKQNERELKEGLRESDIIEVKN